jgi:hypothetical protein
VSRVRACGNAVYIYAHVHCLYMHIYTYKHVACFEKFLMVGSYRMCSVNVECILSQCTMCSLTIYIRTQMFGEFPDDWAGLGQPTRMTGLGFRV